MTICVDEQWQYVNGYNLSEKYVYAGAMLLGRIRRWQGNEPGDLTREWYAAERWKGDEFIAIKEPGVELEEALQLLVFYGVH